jgi:hypothetical protein
VLPIRKDEIGQGHIGLDPAGRHLEGSSRDAKDLLHLPRQRAYGLGLLLNHLRTLWLYCLRSMRPSLN